MRSYTLALGYGCSRIFNMPRLSLPLILTLGFTLGTVLSVIAISSALLLRPLPGIPNEKSIESLAFNLNMSDDLTVPYWNMRQLANFADSYKHLGTWAGIGASERNIKINNLDVYITLYNASDSILEVLGTRLLLGQGTQLDNPHQFVWVSETIWQNYYDRSPQILGKQIRLDGEDKIIAGVLENVMAVESNWQIVPEQVWRITDLTSLVGAPEDGQITSDFPYILVRRTSSSANMPTLNEIETWLENYVSANTNEQAGQGYLSAIKNIPKESQVSDLRTMLLGNTKNLLIALFIAVFGLLLMAILNLLNLFLAHYQNRTKEFALQITMGASLFKLKVLVFLENLPSFVLAITLGLICAAWIIEALPIIANNNLPLVESITLDTTTTLSALAIVLMFSLLVSALCLISVNKQVLIENINSSGKGTQQQNKHWLSQCLMVLQLCIASVLVTASVLLAAQSYKAVYKDLGYDMGNHFVIYIEHKDPEWAVSVTEFPSYIGSELHQLHKQVDELILSTIPNSKIIINSTAPLAQNYSISLSSDPDDPSVQIMYENKDLSANYFTAFNIPLLAGTNLTQQELDASEPFIVIDESMAKASFPGLAYTDIIGQTLESIGPSSSEEGAPFYIVKGIVGNTTTRAGTVSDGGFPSVYSGNLLGDSAIYITVAIPEGESFDKYDLLNEFEKQHPELVLVEVNSLRDIWYQQTASQRVSLYILLGVTCLTLLLSVIGIAGLSQMVTQNKLYELAIHMALGAKQRGLIKFILHDALFILIAGLGLGLFCAILVYQSVQQQLSILPSLNWATLGLTDTGLMIIVILAVIAPAWRIIKADPMVSLRQE